MKSLNELFVGKQLLTVESNQFLKDVVNFMAEHNVGLLPVLENGKLVGVFSERDLVRRVIAKGMDISTTLVSDVMTKQLIIAKIDESYSACLHKMKEAKIRHILVVDGEKLVGVLSMRDLLEIDLSVQKETIEVLNNYIYSR